MAKISKKHQKIKYDDVYHAHFTFVFPPVTQGEKEKRNAEREVIESHQKQIVIGKKKSKQPK